ncbi:MAG: HU family DNA-binding protein [Phycisphaerae bacterium]|nr:HU family DNA-binding protein [Phycisphaerae bacterium]
MATKTKTKPAKTLKIAAVTSPKGRTKGETLNAVVGATGLARKQVSSVFEALNEIMKADLSKKGPGVFKFNGMLKMTTVNKPATKARMGKDPFTGEERMFKAKPASRRVKIRALKSLNAMI